MRSTELEEEGQQSGSSFFESVDHVVDTDIQGLPDGPEKQRAESYRSHDDEPLACLLCGEKLYKKPLKAGTDWVCKPYPRLRGEDMDEGNAKDRFRPVAVVRRARAQVTALQRERTPKKMRQNAKTGARAPAEYDWDSAADMKMVP